MVHKPGHLEFDDAPAKKDVSKTPQAIDFGASGTAEHKPRQSEISPSGRREPSALFNAADGMAIAPAMEFARAKFPDLYAAHELSIERKIRQLIPWQHETVSTWGSRALDENAAVTTRTAQLIKRFSGHGINELVEKATDLAQRGETGLLNRLFLRGKIISFKPALKVAKSQLADLIKDCNEYISLIEPLRAQLSVNLVALVAAHEALAKPHGGAIEAALHSRRVLLQQAIHQAELTALQLHELKQHVAAQLTHVEQLLTITIPAFEIANAAK